MWFGYCRVSTDEQKRGTSLGEQERVIRGAALAEGLGPFDLQIYTDDGVSGSIPLRDRPAGQKIFEALEGDTVIVSKLDRLFRNALDAFQTYELFKKRGIHLIIYEYGFRPITDDNSLSKLFFNILTTFADFERVRIGERMREGKEAKRRKGGHAGGEAPYGYRIEGAGKEARLVPVEEEQAAVRFVASLERGLPATQVAHLLGRYGFRTRTGKRFRPIQAARMYARCADAA